MPLASWHDPGLTTPGVAVKVTVPVGVEVLVVVSVTVAVHVDAAPTITVGGEHVTAVEVASFAADGANTMSTKTFGCVKSPGFSPT